MKDMTTVTGQPPALTPEMRDMYTLGYSITRNVIPRGELERMKVALRGHFRRAGAPRDGGRVQTHGLHAMPKAARFLLSDPIAEVMRRHTFDGTVLLTGDCELKMNTASDWHKDVTPDMQKAEIFSDVSFGIYKLAVYLQDQEDTSPTALRVRPGTQFMDDGSAVEEKRLGVRAGDVVIFDVRMDHAGPQPGLAMRALTRPLRLISRPMGLDHEALLTRLSEKMPGRRLDRLAMFLTFGPDTPATRRYGATGRLRHGPAPAPLSPDAVQRLNRLNLDMIPAGG